MTGERRPVIVVTGSMPERCLAIAFGAVLCVGILYVWLWNGCTHGNYWELFGTREAAFRGSWYVEGVLYLSAMAGGYMLARRHSDWTWAAILRMALGWVVFPLGVTLAVVISSRTVTGSWHWCKALATTWPILLVAWGAGYLLAWGTSTRARCSSPEHS